VDLSGNPKTLEDCREHADKTFATAILVIQLFFDGELTVDQAKALIPDYIKYLQISLTYYQ